MQGLQAKLEAPILDVVQWIDGLLDSVYGPVTVMHIRDDIQAMRAEAVRALAQIEPLLHAVEHLDVRNGINLAHSAENMLQRVRVSYVFRFRVEYAHRLTKLHLNILNRIEASSLTGCEYFSRIKTYLTLLNPRTTVNCHYYYLPTVLRDYLRAMQMDVKLHIASVVSEVYGNIDGLRRALGYVLENRRHAGDSAEIQIIATRENESWVHLLLLDNGSGIHPEDAPCIFEPFYQAKSDDPSIGLGLTLAQRLMRQQGGDIQIYDGHAQTSPNKGAGFVLLLPTGVTKPQ